MTTEAYVYDAAHQLTEIHQGSITGPLVASLGYDPNGNLTTKIAGATTTALTYDVFNRLVQVAKTGQATQYYTYDGQGRRIEKVVGSNTMDYLYNGPDIVAEYYGASWTNWTTAVASATYTHGPQMDAPLLRTTATGTQYYHQDGLGSVVAMSDAAGATTGTARYDAWGNAITTTGTLPQYGYTGREPDETGLIYDRARYYDPAIGRFTQRDPIGLHGGINPYAYVNNNPITYTDPTGLSAFNPSQLGTVVSATSYYGAGLTAPGAESGLTSSTQSLALVGTTSVLAESAWSFGLPGLQATGDATLGAIPGPAEAGAAGLGVIVGPLIGAAALVLGLPSTTQSIEDERLPTIYSSEGNRASDILMPGGQPIGDEGSRPEIRELPGGRQGAQDMFDHLSKGGKVINDPDYPGTRVELPDGGGYVGFRPVSSPKSGGAPTVDINVPGVPIDKLKYPLGR